MNYVNNYSSMSKCKHATSNTIFAVVSLSTMSPLFMFLFAILLICIPVDNNNNNSNRMVTMQYTLLTTTSALPTIYHVCCYYCQQ